MKLVHFGRFALAASGLAMAVAMPAHADITHTFATQSSITVLPTTIESSARTASLAVSGNNVTVATSLGSISSDGVITAPGAATVTVPGSAFTYNVSVADEDTVAGPTIASGTVTATPDYSTQTTQVGGLATGATVTALSSGVGTAVIGTAVGTTVSTLQQASLSVFK